MRFLNFLFLLIELILSCTVSRWIIENGCNIGNFDLIYHRKKKVSSIGILLVTLWRNGITIEYVIF